MRHVRASVVQANFRVTCEFETAFLRTVVFNSKGANFRIGMWVHTYGPGNLDVPGASREFGTVPMKTVLTGVVGRENRLMPD